MTRAEVRLYLCKDSEDPVAKFYQNADANPKIIVPLLAKGVTEAKFGHNTGGFYKVMAEELDNEPVANVSYIYSVYLSEGVIESHTVTLRDMGDYPLWCKGKFISSMQVAGKERILETV